MKILTMNNVGYFDFQNAARENDLKTLQKCTRKDTNKRDLDGMTPVHWAAGYGNLEALRILVGKGGNPDKPNNEGSTSLHLAAGAGQLHCLVYLSNFGGNVHGVDDNGVTPMQEAANKGRIECVRHLESLVTHQVAQDRMKVEKMQLKAKRDAEKRIKEKTKLMRKLDRDYEKKTSKHRKAFGLPQNYINVPSSSAKNDNNNSDVMDSSRNRKQTYSQLTGLLRSDGESTEYESSRSNIDDESTSNESYRRLDEDSYTHISQTSDDIVFERGKFTNNDDDKLSAITETTNLSKRAATQTKSLPLYKPNNNGFLQNGNLFNRDLPGEVVTLKNGQIINKNESIQSARLGNGQLLQRPDAAVHAGNVHPSKRKEKPIGYAEIHMGPLYTFLHALQLDEFREIFLHEKIDLRACLLCDENDLREIGLPLGPRKKVIHAISKRKQLIKECDEMHDSPV